MTTLAEQQQLNHVWGQLQQLAQLGNIVQQAPAWTQSQIEGLALQLPAGYSIAVALSTEVGLPFPYPSPLSFFGVEGTVSTVYESDGSIHILNTASGTVGLGFTPVAGELEFHLIKGNHLDLLGTATQFEASILNGFGLTVPWAAATWSEWGSTLLSVITAETVGATLQTAPNGTTFYTLSGTDIGTSFEFGATYNTNQLDDGGQYTVLTHPDGTQTTYLYYPTPSGWTSTVTHPDGRVEIYEGNNTTPAHIIHITPSPDQSQDFLELLNTDGSVTFSTFLPEGIISLEGGGILQDIVTVEGQTIVTLSGNVAGADTILVAENATVYAYDGFVAQDNLLSQSVTNADGSISVTTLNPETGQITQDTISVDPITSETFHSPTQNGIVEFGEGRYQLDSGVADADLIESFQDAPDLTLFDVSAFDEDSAAYFTDGLVNTIPENMSVVAADINGVPTYDLVSNNFTLVADEVAYTSLSASYWQQALGPVDWGLYGSELVYSIAQLAALQDSLVWNAEQLAFAIYDTEGYDTEGYDYNGLDLNGHDGYWSAGTNNNSSGIGATYTNSDGSTESFGVIGDTSFNEEDLESFGHAVEDAYYDVVDWVSSWWKGPQQQTVSIGSYFNGQVWGGAVGGLGDDIITVIDTNLATADKQIDGAGGNDILSGGIGDDVIRGGSGADQLRGGAGDDTLYFDGADSIVDGGAGYDTALLTQATAISFDLGAHNLESIVANIGSDYLVAGDASSATIDGGAGNDSIVGGLSGDILSGSEGDDVIAAGGGDDLVQGGAGNDRLSGDNGDDNIIGGAGRDVIIGGAGNDTLSGGGGGDIFSYDKTAFGDDVIQDFTPGSDRISIDSFQNINRFSDLVLADDGEGNTVITLGSNATVFGSITLTGVLPAALSASDFIISLDGSAANDVLVGGAGDDIVNGYSGSDYLYGLDGNDLIRGGAGAVDVLIGGNGDDTLYGESGFDYLYGGRGDDILIGGGGVNVMHGNAGTDLLYGGAAVDWLYGGSGNDTLYGHGSADQIFGGSGNDRIDGGSGNDWIWGGSGADIFSFGNASGVDVIYDFENGIDRLDLSGSSASSINDLSIGQIQGGFTWISDGTNVVYLSAAAGQTLSASNIGAEDFLF